MSLAAKGKPKIFNRKSVLQFDLDGKFIKKWSSPKEAGEQLNLDSVNIRAAARGKQETSYGYKWKYE
jgi:hypothetical protein